MQQPRRGRPPKNIGDEAEDATVPEMIKPVVEPDDEVATTPAVVPVPVHEEPAYEAPAQTRVEDVLGTLR